MKRLIPSLVALMLALSACTGPPPPAQIDAFTNIYNQSAANVPTDAPMTLAQPVAFITSENVERYIGHLKTTNEYWASVVPSTLTNTAIIADTDPTYFSHQILAMLKRRYPDLQYVHDFREAVSLGKKGVILIDLRVKQMEPYGDRTYKIDIDAYFFDSAMNPVSKLNGHSEYKVPFAAMEVKFQAHTDEAIANLESKMNAYIR
jgi:hypothetical protein